MKERGIIGWEGGGVWESEGDSSGGSSHSLSNSKVLTNPDDLDNREEEEEDLAILGSGILSRGIEEP